MTSPNQLPPDNDPDQLSGSAGQGPFVYRPTGATAAPEDTAAILIKDDFEQFQSSLTKLDQEAGHGATVQLPRVTAEAPSTDINQARRAVNEATAKAEDTPPPTQQGPKAKPIDTETASKDPKTVTAERPDGAAARKSWAGNKQNGKKSKGDYRNPKRNNDGDIIGRGKAARNRQATPESTPNNGGHVEPSPAQLTKIPEDVKHGPDKADQKPVADTGKPKAEAAGNPVSPERQAADAAWSAAVEKRGTDPKRDDPIGDALSQGVSRFANTRVGGFVARKVKEQLGITDAKTNAADTTASAEKAEEAPAHGSPDAPQQTAQYDAGAVAAARQVIRDEMKRQAASRGEPVDTAELQRRLAQVKRDEEMRVAAALTGGASTSKPEATAAPAGSDEKSASIWRGMGLIAKDFREITGRKNTADVPATSEASELVEEPALLTHPVVKESDTSSSSGDHGGDQAAGTTMSKETDRTPAVTPLDAENPDHKLLIEQKMERLQKEMADYADTLDLQDPSRQHKIEQYERSQFKEINRFIKSGGQEAYPDIDDGSSSADTKDGGPITSFRGHDRERMQEFRKNQNAALVEYIKDNGLALNNKDHDDQIRAFKAQQREEERLFFSTGNNPYKNADASKDTLDKISPYTDISQLDKRDLKDREIIEAVYAAREKALREFKVANNLDNRNPAHRALYEKRHAELYPERGVSAGDDDPDATGVMDSINVDDNTSGDDLTGPFGFTWTGSGGDVGNRNGDPTTATPRVVTVGSSAVLGAVEAGANHSEKSSEPEAVKPSVMARIGLRLTELKLDGVQYVFKREYNPENGKSEGVHVGRVATALGALTVGIGAYYLAKNGAFHLPVPSGSAHEGLVPDGNPLDRAPAIGGGTSPDAVNGQQPVSVGGGHGFRDQLNGPGSTITQDIRDTYHTDESTTARLAAESVRLTKAENPNFDPTKMSGNGGYIRAAYSPDQLPGPGGAGQNLANGGAEQLPANVTLVEPGQAGPRSISQVAFDQLQSKNIRLDVGSFAKFVEATKEQTEQISAQRGLKVYNPTNMPVGTPVFTLSDAQIAEFMQRIADEADKTVKNGR